MLITFDINLVLSSSLATSVPEMEGSSPEAINSVWGTHHVTFLNADLQSFYSHKLEPLEQGLSIYSCNLWDTDSGDTPPVGCQNREYVVVGTAFVVPGESEPKKGRILVFKVERLTSATGGKGASVAVDYDNVDEHAMYDQTFCYKRICELPYPFFCCCLGLLRKGMMNSLMALVIFMYHCCWKEKQMVQYYLLLV